MTLNRVLNTRTAAFGYSQGGGGKKSKFHLRKKRKRKENPHLMEERDRPLVESLRIFVV